ncbi:TetR/AcrR family transcriptional regulator [Nocardiopsis alba]|uniref:TetR/AcrR family transcriptional regulator n=1 Tax=Nocardiopsis TaxID=2013 RepID=UPI002DB8B771|nr:TetR/AcrR family transcriptional regulator [Nocardiopsis sp. LDBS1602]MEC3891507.1 TetR/AcrR family transcriptional regulator [Nocardiopsis sp. LDBS1602]
MTSTENPRRGARGRTRRAILRAAASVLAHDRNAPLSAVAERAEVGRSTLHRYFPDRGALLAATFEESLSEMGRALEEARPEEGPALEAMRRVVSAHVEVIEWVVFAFGDPANEVYMPDDADPEPDFLLDLVRRGQDEGVLDPGSDPSWVVHVLWALLFTGMEQVEAGRMPRHSLAPTLIRTLEGGILARG